MGSNKEEKSKGPFQWSKFFGTALFIFGALCAADLVSPERTPIAVVLGTISIVSGVFLLIPNKMAWLKKKLLRWSETPRKKILSDPMVPVRILKLAKEHEGILTLSTVAVELELPLDEAEAGLDECVRSGQATADYDMEKQIKFYRFHEHIRIDGKNLLND